MGLLVVGTPLPWEDALEHLNYVRTHGIEQFLQTYNRVKNLSGDVLKWGDELEYGIYQIHAPSKTIRLSCRAPELLALLSSRENTDALLNEGCNWLPEYGAWMVEATPSVPYGGLASDLSRVETNMRLRRARILSVLRDDEIAPSVTCFPLLGVLYDHHSMFNEDRRATTSGPIAQSDYVSDDVINPHPRFGTLTANIRKRRGRKIDIRVPVYQDTNTTLNGNRGVRKGSIDDWSAESSRPTVKKRTSNHHTSTQSSNNNEGTLTEPYPGYVHMDCMAFGMGMCCLQVTFQAKNVGESRHLYDHLGVLSPIFLAATAATPILKGFLVDTDVRWATISAAVDDRTTAEMGRDGGDDASYDPRMAGGGVKPIRKSRYEGISWYICNHKDGSDPNASLGRYNDIDIPYDEQSFETLVSRGIDPLLAKHVAHLFIRDPLVIYDERISLDDTVDTDHFENIQSTNWQTVRWKPPPPPSATSSAHVGWRTEFRSMEIQLTDFENAAYSVFLVLVTRVILTFDLNLYIPLSKVEHNMEVAHSVDAVSREKFYFRSHLAPPEASDCENRPSCEIHNDDPNRCELMTVGEIMMGKGSYYPGLIPLVRAYLDHIEADEDTLALVTKYLALIEKRATGELPTTATWIRNFVTSHPSYKQDSVVAPDIAFDLMTLCSKIGNGTEHCPELLGDFVIDPISSVRAYGVPLTSASVAESKRQKLLHRYTTRSPCKK